MDRIKKIHINNFKFFPEFEPIQINGKNVLLYGENGSGKSSIYWALYTLLESAEKNDETQIQKYFNRNKDESLVNIHATVDENGIDNSFVKITLEDDTEFEISHQNTVINDNSDAKESLLASDFLNYKLLQRAHNVRHSQVIDLFPLFSEAVFNYVQFEPVNWHKDDGTAIQLTNAGSILKIVETGPDKKYPKLDGNDGYPTKKSHRQAFDEHRDLSEGFRNGLDTLIEKIRTKANPILKTKLGYDITFHLELKIDIEQKLTIANYTPPKFTLKLIIDDFEGNGAVLKPQSFLNEARLSAIALSIRLAILEERISDAKVKILVLDDLMISLDMSNRDKVIRLVLDEYAWWKDEENDSDKGHQTFILTHDRSLFTFIQHNIDNLIQTKKDTWNSIEMYAKDIDENIPNDIEKPVIFYDQNDFSIAVKHFKAFDYPASANYLRKYSEKILCDWLPEYCWKDKASRDKSNNKMALRNIVENAIYVFWPSFDIECPEYKELLKYVRILLNPLSHADVGVERYKEEIRQVIQILEKIKILHSEFSLETIISGGSHIQLIQIKNGDTYIAEYELKDSLYKLNDADGNIKFNSFKGKMIGYRMLTDAELSPFNGQNKTMEENHSDFIANNTLTSSANWMDDLFKTDGVKLL